MKEMNSTEDAFTLGRRIAAEEAERSRLRVERALPYGNEVLWCDLSTSDGEHTREHLAEALYKAAHDHHEPDGPTDRDVLDSFCWTIFNCTYEEVLKAWDATLGD